MCSSDLMAAADRIPTLGTRLAEGESLEAILTDLFNGLDAVTTDRFAPAFSCDCTRARLERALLSIGETELREIIEQDGRAELKCQFCGKAYRFDRAALTALLSEATDNGGTDEE